LIAASAKQRYIPAFDFRPDGGVSRDAMGNSLKLMEEAIAGARK
jgi:hypothetical protein